MAEALCVSRNNPINKADLRSAFIQLRSRLPTLYRDQASRQITQTLLAHPAVQAATHISCYISYDHEVDTHDLVSELIAQHKHVSVPTIRQNSICLKSFHSLSECLPGAKHILEPPETNPTIDPRQVEVFIVPGLAFDAHGYRLGYGKGYYDRLLQNTTGLRLGIGFTDQLTYQLPHESWDITMDQIITDTISLFPKRR